MYLARSSPTVLTGFMDASSSGLQRPHSGTPRPPGASTPSQPLPLHRQRCRAHRAHRWNRRSRPRRTRSSAPARMCRPRHRPSALRRAPASAELSGGALELPHQLLAEALAPLGVEAAPPQLFLEGLGVYVVEDEALRRELVAQARIKARHVLPVLKRLRIHVASEDLLQVVRQPRPGTPVDEEPPAVPHVVRDRAELLHLV